MSRVAKKPIQLPAGVQVTFADQILTIKGGKGTLQQQIPAAVNVTQAENVLQFSPAANIENADAIAGTVRAAVYNIVIGVTQGFERKLTLIGVGYRAQSQGRKLNLNLGYSHPIVFEIPEGITIETPSQTEVIVKGSDKQKVGKVAAEIRSFRAPEPYKGKGVRYFNEVIQMKEAKKK